MSRVTYTDGTYRYFVRNGLGGCWITVRQRLEKPASSNECSHRVKSPNLPPRTTEEEATADLIKYAFRRRYRHE